MANPFVFEMLTFKQCREFAIRFAISLPLVCHYPVANPMLEKARWCWASVDIRAADKMARGAKNTLSNIVPVGYLPTERTATMPPEACPTAWIQGCQSRTLFLGE